MSHIKHLKFKMSHITDSMLLQHNPRKRVGPRVRLTPKLCSVHTFSYLIGCITSFFLLQP